MKEIVFCVFFYVAAPCFSPTLATSAPWRLLFTDVGNERDVAPWRPQHRAPQHRLKNDVIGHNLARYALHDELRPAKSAGSPSSNWKERIPHIHAPGQGEREHSDGDGERCDDSSSAFSTTAHSAALARASRSRQRRRHITEQLGGRRPW